MPQLENSFSHPLQMGSAFEMKVIANLPVLLTNGLRLCCWNSTDCGCLNETGNFQRDPFLLYSKVGIGRIQVLHLTNYPCYSNSFLSP